jgi:hypothetical protein
MSAAQNPWPPIGQLFVEQGRLTPLELEDALEAQRATNEPLGEILVERGHISRIDLAAALSKQWSWRHREVELPPEPKLEPEARAPETPAEEPIAQIHALPSAVALPPPPPPAPEPPAAPPAAPPPAATTLPSSEEDVRPTTFAVRTEVYAELVGRLSALEAQERVVTELQSRLNETREQFAAGNARLRQLESMVEELLQAKATLGARLEAQTREIEDLRRSAAEQAARLTSAGRSLLT